MIAQAETKIKNEMEKEKNPYVKVIGDFLINFINENESEAEKIIAKDKTIMGSLKEMRKEANKHKVGNMAMLTPEQGFNVVLKYFGIKDKDVKVDYAINGQNGKEEEKTEFNVELDDLL